MPQSSKKLVSDVQRKALRDHVHSQPRRPTQKACIAWFYAQYNHRLSQSTVSDILSSQYQYLDSKSNPSTSLRKSTGQWQDLENILYEWQQTLDLRGAYISGDILIEKAHQIWNSLPQYHGQPPPLFSNGWLHRFKQRFNIKQHTHHGEAGSVPKEAEEEMKAIHTIAGQYSEDDIYNMDETGLFWRMPPSQSLSSFNRPGIKKDKSRVSIICCLNASGTDRLPIWVIGKARVPRALRNVNICAIGAEWRWNKKAWMDQIIMREWLLSFYSHIGHRSILLTMDNFSAHLAGLELAPPPPNIRICWLPKNSTSKFQPLDQGIIQNLKIYYRKQWLRYILYHYEHNQDPLHIVTLLDCIRWLIRAWNHDILSSTILACFYKSTLVLNPVQLSIETPNLLPLYHQVQQSGHLSNCMDIASFLNPVEESSGNEEELSSEGLLEQLIARASDTGGIYDDDDQEDDSPEPAPLPKLSDALNAVQLLISYMEGQHVSRAPLLRSLERLERDLDSEMIASRTQGTLDSWLR